MFSNVGWRQLAWGTMETRALFQYRIWRLIIRSRKVWKPRDLYLELHDCSAIWQAHWHQCCRCVCQISKRCDNLNYQSRGFDISRDLKIRRFIRYGNGAQVWLLFIVERTLHSTCFYRQSNDTIYILGSRLVPLKDKSYFSVRFEQCSN